MYSAEGTQFEPRWAWLAAKFEARVVPTEVLQHGAA